ncbi:MAG TPA: asparagine synthase (glutamine-hydrolyzing), partial [Bacteroidia bacterium]
MSDQLEHRGPDGAGTRLLVLPDCTIGLAHRRLSIIDLTETGTQPMAFDGVLVTFNGEIYNYKEIRHDLQVLGHTFVGGSDTEVILHAYKQWGINCIERFIGMFSFVMYDEKQGKLFCVRDRAGVKPFYYYRTNDLFLFASELKAFHRHPGFDRELDHSAVAAFMQFGNIPGTHCVFKNCNKLSPGHYGVFDLKSRTLELHKYWDVYDYYNKPKLGIDWEEAKTETENLLVSAASYRMIADVPVGVFLSGGYDSACLTALLQKNTSEKLKTYTIAVSDLGLNEAPFAKEVAELLGTDHHELECSSQEALTLIDQLPFYYDEPFA